jgi:dihydrodipicolinate synthase/N-acetylneuraminate lyase
MYKDGTVMVETARPLIDFYVKEKADGLYMLGWTGEGMSLDVKRRIQWTEAVLKANAGKLPIFVHVGYNENIEDSVELAMHAAEHGAFAVASVGIPNAALSENAAYFKRIAEAAPQTPFYIYWVAGSPFMNNGAKVSVTGMLEAMASVSTFRGIKFTDTDLFTLERFKKHAPHINILTGADEIAVCSQLMGADGCIGSLQAVTCYHFKAQRKLAANGDYIGARHMQYLANNLAEEYSKPGAGSLPAIKLILERVHGIATGYCDSHSPYIPKIEDSAVAERLLRAYHDNIMTAGSNYTREH